MEPVVRSWSFEAKVSDWRAGIWQCLRYATSADATGLVLGDVSSRARAAAVTAAREHGVGVFIGGKWLVRPRRHPLPTPRRLWVSEHFLDAYLAPTTGQGAHRPSADA